MSLFGGPKLFGATSTSSLFTSGTQASSATSSAFTGGFNFGTSATTQAANLFQPTVSKPTNNLFGGFGTSTQSQPFGLNVAKTTPSLLGTGFSIPAVSQTSNLFGTSTSQPSLGFGTLKAQQPFGSSLPTQTSINTGLFSGIGVPTATQAAQPAQQSGVDAFFTSLCQPLMFGDERDTILARWNQLQSMWGFGTGYSALGVAVYTPENPFARFKTIAYNRLPASTDADGLVCLFLSRPFSQVIEQRQGLQDTLFRLLGGRPNLQLVIEEIRPCIDNENNTEVILKVCERQATGVITHVSASELEKYLSSPSVAPQLQSQLCAYRLTAEVTPSASQLALYSENPPAGIDRLVWQQAVTDNPTPDRTIPVPLIGFADLRRRRLAQLAFGDQQNNALKQIGELVRDMKTGQLAITQKVAQLKRKQIEISHRILNVLRRQEVNRRSGFPIGANEEALRCGLERIWTELTSSRGLRIRMHDVLSAVRAGAIEGSKQNGSFSDNSVDYPSENSQINSGQMQTKWNLDEDTLSELKEYLSQRQNGIRELQHLLVELSGTISVIENHKPGVQSNAAATLQRPLSNRVSFALGSRVL